MKNIRVFLSDCICESKLNAWWDKPNPHKVSHWQAVMDLPVCQRKRAYNETWRTLLTYNQLQNPKQTKQFFKRMEELLKNLSEEFSQIAKEANGFAQEDSLIGRET